MMLKRWISPTIAALVWFGLVPTAARVMASTPEDALSKPVRIVVVPNAIELSTARDRQSIVVQAEFADGSTREVTAEITATVVPRSHR